MDGWSPRVLSSKRTISHSGESIAGECPVEGVGEEGAALCRCRFGDSWRSTLHKVSFDRYESLELVGEEISENESVLSEIDHSNRPVWCEE